MFPYNRTYKYKDTQYNVTLTQQARCALNLEDYVLLHMSRREGEQGYSEER